MKVFYCSMLMMVSTTYATILLQEPTRLSVSEVDACVKKWKVTFQWRLGVGRMFTCFYERGKASMLLQLFGVPVRSHNFGYWNHVKKTVAAYFDTTRPTYPYYYAKPLFFGCALPTCALPKTLSLDELCLFLKERKFICYTGAGISASAGVATMGELERSLMLTQGRKAFLTTVFFHPETITTAFSRFCEAALSSEPTAAHHALHDLAQRRRNALITENFDLLHQRAGSAPLSTHSEELHSLTSKDFKQVDCIVCIGLRYDDCGFLARYKEEHPQGVLVAIDIITPTYVSKSDYWVQGDLQMIVPALDDALR